MLAAVFCPTTKKRQMIKANEIRIGNYLKGVYGTHIVHTIAMISGEYVLSYFNSPFSSKHDGLVDLKDCTPIELTEQWLIDFGFIKGEKYWSYRGLDVDLNQWFGYQRMVANAPLQYVHQLQNLYFALNGQELSVVANGS